jgi:hypothetical protein
MKPTRCGRCGGDLSQVAGRGEQWDPRPGYWVGFLDCPACGAMFVYLRRGAPPSSLRSHPSEATP